MVRRCRKNTTTAEKTVFCFFLFFFFFFFLIFLFSFYKKMSLQLHLIFSVDENTIILHIPCWFDAVILKQPNDYMPWSLVLDDRRSRVVFSDRNGGKTTTGQLGCPDAALVRKNAAQVARSEPTSFFLFRKQRRQDCGGGKLDMIPWLAQWNDLSVSLSLSLSLSLSPRLKRHSQYIGSSCS